MITEFPSNPEENPPEAESSGGGSAAAQAFRAQAAAIDGAAVPAGDAPIPAPASAAPGRIEARAAERKKVSGRARFTLQNGRQMAGKVLDLSATGASVMLEDMVASKQTGTLECDIFQNGKRFVFSVPAMSVYGVLVSGKGFKVGFMFGPRSPAATKTIAELVS
jgi:hypothetical protein